jgi:LacI family transcriptional regulator
MGKVTLKDIANELGVTVGTVSHVLNGIDDISEETKLRVLEAARRLGYISNGLAASLRSGKTNTVAVIVPDISNPHLAYQIKLIEDKMRELNYSVVILNTNEDEKIEYKAITTACSRQVDGILLCPCQKSLDNIKFLDNLNIPYALIGRFFENFETDYICADDEKSGYLAGKFLIEKGCKSPLYVGAHRHIEAASRRFLGVRKAFFEQGISLGDDRFVQTDTITGGNANIIKDILDEGFSFDSVVAFSDVIAFEIAPQIKSLCKEPIPVVGFDAINSHLPLPFYNVSVGMINNGWAAAATDIIIGKINGSDTTCRKFIDVALFEFNK